MEIRDAYDNLRAADNTSTISIGIQNNTGGGTLSGTLTQPTSGGVATFIYIGGPTYLYHPLTPTDMSAFDEFILRDGDYSFLDGALNIVGHEGLLPFLK